MLGEKKRSIIRLKGVKNGDEACIFYLPKKLYFINVSFFEDNVNIDVQSDCPDNLLLTIHKTLSSSFKEKVYSKKKIFRKCKYVLGYYKNKFYLLFYLHEKIPMSYTLTKKCAKLLELECLESCWEGELSYAIPYVFEEDILIQKK